MVTRPWMILPCPLVAIFVLVGCADSAGNTGGSGGSAGIGGIAGMPDAGVSCVESGCQDDNDCTTDGMCEPMSGQCVGAGVEPTNTPCGQNGIFVCDGEGRCVGCNVDEQCEAFFPDECLEDSQCINKACPPPDPLPDGTPCSSGECRSGVCSGPWAPTRKLVPIACGSSFSPALFDSSMDLTVAPTPIMPAAQFNATLDSALLIPQALLQQAVIASFPTPLPSIEVTGARAEIATTRVASGTPVNTTLAPLPQTVMIPQVANPGDRSGQLCETHDDCPLGEFGQLCAFAGRCVCACGPGCFPENCANLVTGGLVLRLETIQGAIYGAFRSGEVCFDVAGDASDPDVGLPIRTGIRVTADAASLAIECEGGTVNDNGTPDLPEDDLVDINLSLDQICFPIGFPEPPPQ
ncbi:MAG: hypothetical protein OEM15_16475 [Myxococcales bacterium]|nr:hypothetical protein [Myxococcales bacterium]